MKQVDTGLVERAGFTVIRDVLGQLSDGMWENSPAMKKYWKNANVKIIDNRVFLILNDDFQSPYAGMTEKEIKAWFAKKAKQVVKFSEVSWKRDSTSPADGFSDSLTVSDICRVYDKLLERRAR